MIVNRSVPPEVAADSASNKNKDENESKKSDKSVSSKNEVKDSTAPIPAGAASSFSPDSLDFTKAVLSWSASGSDSESGVIGQTLRFFADDNTGCNGDPDYEISISSSTTSYILDLLNAKLTGILRFLVRSTNGAGLTSDSPCSDAVNFRNGILTLGGTADNQAISYITSADITCDGTPDILAGNKYAAGGGTQSGVLLVYPGETLHQNPTPVFVYTGDRAWGRIGSSLNGQTEGARIADLNKDGCDDIIMYSADSYSLDGLDMNAGVIYVILGNATLPASGVISSAALTYSGDDYYWGLGDGLGIVDINGDGYLDIHSHYYRSHDGVNSDLGALYIIPGGNSLPASGLISITGRAYHGANKRQRFGWNMRTADINGDGYLDFYNCYPSILAGAPTWLSVYFGAATFPVSNNLTALTNGRTYSFSDGSIISCSEALGDLNNDGYKEIIVFEYGADPSALSNAGTVAVVIGGASYPSSGSFSRRYDGSVAGDELGGSLAIGDINNDGFNDLVIGGSGADPGGRTDAGKIWLIPGASTLPSSGTAANAGYVYEGMLNSDGLGSWLDIADLNNDGYREIISRYSSASPGGLAGAGSLYVIPGASTFFASGILSSIAGYRRYNGTEVGMYFCDSIAGNVLYDVNGDGLMDVVCSNITSTVNGLSNVGTFAILLAGAGALPASGDASAQLKFYHGDGTNDRLGGSLYIRDINNDSFDDIVLVSPYSAVGGSVIVFKGGVALPANGAIGTTSTIRIDGGPGGSLGQNLQWIDLTGDGADDLVSHYSLANVGFTYNGIINLIPTGASFPTASGTVSTVGKQFVGQANSHNYELLPGSFDLNGDGRRDLIVKSNPAVTPSMLQVVFGKANFNDLNLSALSSSANGDPTGMSSTSDAANLDLVANRNAIVTGSSSASTGAFTNNGALYLLYNYSVP